MSKQPNIRQPRGRLRLVLALVLAASLLAQSRLGLVGAARPIHAERSTAADVQQATLILQPASGPVGTLVSISATGFPREADLSNGATLSFDSTPIAGEQVPIAGCVGQPTLTFGFGPACNPNSSALTYTIPANTAPGNHTFVATAASTAGTFTSNPATFTVLAPAGSTGTSTATVFMPQPTATMNMPTVTGTATSTATVAPGTATGTATGTSTATQTPSVPTVTLTPVPPSPTPTATKVVRPQAIVLIKPAFSAGAVAMVIHAGANAHVAIDFQVLAPNAQGHQQRQYDLKKTGAANSLGVFTIRMAIAYHKPGMAVITIALSSGGKTQTVRRSYRYGGS
jgi:hypothetical protein